MPVARIGVSTPTRVGFNFSTYTWGGFTVPADCKLIIAFFSANLNTGAQPGTPTWNGVGMTQIQEGIVGDFHSAHYLENPDTGNHNLVHTWSEPMNWMKGALVYLKDYDTSDPIGNSNAGTGTTVQADSSVDLVLSFAMNRSTSTPINVSGGDLTEWVVSAVDNGFSVGYKEDPSSTVVTNCNWDADRARQINLVVHGTAPAGNRIMMMFSQVWDQWQKRTGLLVPKGMGELWKPEPQILVA